MSKLIVSLSPHIHNSDCVQRNMYGVIFALMPALLVSFYYFGIGSVVVCSVSVASCVLFEWTIAKHVMRRTPTLLDGSAVVTGLLLGMNLPSNMPIWIVMLGAMVAIGVGKMTFGGLGSNLFNPALVGRCFLLVSFPLQMTSWPVAGQDMAYLDAATGATPLSVMKTAITTQDPTVLEQMPDAIQMVLGNVSRGGAGSLGEVCGLALLLGLAFMLYKRIVTWHTPVSIIATVAAVSALLHYGCATDGVSVYADPLTVIFSGGLLLGAIFMATDYVTSPMTPRGQLVYGVSIGLLTVVIRNWGSMPEGMSFAILIMNAFTPLINNYFKPKRFGEATSK